MTQTNTLTISESQQQANAGDAQVRLESTDSHEKGKDAAIQYNFASTWLAKADEQGIPCGEAQYLLAVCYRRGIGVEQSNELYFEWLRKAAEQVIKKQCSNFSIVTCKV